MKRQYSQPLVDAQETKCAVIRNTLSPPLHFTVTIMTRCGEHLNTVGLVTTNEILFNNKDLKVDVLFICVCACKYRYLQISINISACYFSL